MRFFSRNHSTYSVFSDSDYPGPEAEAETVTLEIALNHLIDHRLMHGIEKTVVLVELVEIVELVSV